jgi:hypothetical protein
MLRVPFEIAISEPKMLKKHWDTLKGPQQAVLLAFYGCPLSQEKDDRGWSQEDYFWAAQGFGVFDDLGYLQALNEHPQYVAKEYRELWMVAGVRSGKSLIAATIAAYEAICGGHEESIKDGGRAYGFLVAQDLRAAQKAVIDFQVVLNAIPFVNKPYTGPGNYDGRMVSDPTSTRINFWNGMTIMTMPPTIKAIRGYDSPLAILDEIGVWPTDKDQANVDSEVYDQALSRQATFDNGKMVGLSSPWIMSGMLYDRWRAGTDGRNIFCSPCEIIRATERDPNCPSCFLARESSEGKLVYHLPTAAFYNPMVKASWLKAKKAENPANFRRECMAEFQSSAASFLNPDYVEACVAKGVVERPPVVREPGKKLSYEPAYVAALDPGFSRDAFAFGIGHMDEKGVVVMDLIRHWKPQKGMPNNPAEILKEITPLMRMYNCTSALSDQAHFASLEQMALDQGWAIELLNFSSVSKNNIFGNLYTLVNQKKISLLDRQEVTHELKALQRTLTNLGSVQISAPPGLHDDLAVIVALIASRAVWLDPTAHVSKTAETHDTLIEAQIARRHRMLRAMEED